MTSYRVGIIGCGRRPEILPDGRRRGFGIAESHAQGYEAHPLTAIVAAADIQQTNLDDFCQRHHVPGRYTDYREMLDKERLDIVSVCTWVGMHPEAMIAAADARPQGILCEKPMALTLPQADAMIAAADRNNVRFAINHQRRLGIVFGKAKEYLTQGAIGDLQRLEGYVPRGNLLDWGTHWIDMFFFYMDQTPASWVMAMGDRRTDRSLFGVDVEDHSITHIAYQQGVRGYIEIGVPIAGQPANRLLGTDGMIEVGVTDGPQLRIRMRGEGQWTVPEIPGGIHGVDHFKESVSELVAAIEEGREARHSGRNGRQALEVILAGYESMGRRGRVDLPLMITDDPIARLIALWKQQS